MKMFTYLLFGTLLFLACNRPMKLLEKGKSEKALKVSMKRLKGGKVKEDNLYVLEKSFFEVTEKDARWIASMKNQGDPAVWLQIHKKAKAMHKRQGKLKTILSRLNKKGHFPDLDWYPTGALVEEATDNVALYYYAKAQEFIPTAKRDNREAARKAYRWLEEVQKFRPGFKDSDALLAEMHSIGTTHLLLNPIEHAYNSYRDRSLYAVFLGRQVFPKRQKWKVIHLDRPTNEKIDFRLDLNFDDVYVSWDNESCTTCSNTVSVQDGYELIEVWNAQDSIYVTERRPVYIDVSVQVNNYTQHKHARLGLLINLIDESANEQIHSFRLAHTEEWTNDYSEVCGDERALNGSCNAWFGSKAFYPSDSDLLMNAARGIDYRFYPVVYRKVD